MVTRFNEDKEVKSRRVSVDWECGGMLLYDTVYLYPDMETSLVGDWSNASHKMSSARQANITCLSVDSDHILSVSHGECFGPEYSYAPAGENNFGNSDPMLIDPYENR